MAVYKQFLKSTTAAAAAIAILAGFQGITALPLPGTAEWDSGFIGENALQHVYVLASDSLCGRYSGFRGSDKAENYVAQHFRSLDLLEPFGDDGYFQNFTYGAGEYCMPSSMIIYFPDGSVDTARMWEDFNVYKYSGFGRVSGKVVFAGYGISAPSRQWDELEGFDLNGKIVLAVRGVPDLTGMTWGREGASGYKSTTAMDRGAVGFMMTQGDPPKYATISERYFRENLPAAWISKSLADKILGASGRTKDQWIEELESTDRPVTRELDVEIDLQVSGDYYPERQTRNVAAILPGSDPDLKRELVVIGAHIDHHGIDAAGNLYPGADDNASGTAAMMELARVFSECAQTPARSIMFIGFAAEEEGLVGSGVFVDSLPLNDYTVVAMLNMDMVGLGSGEVGVGGLNEFAPLGEMFRAWEDSALQEIHFWGLHGSSDQASFADAGIPAYIIGAPGKHANYHTPYDTAGAIKPEVLKAVGDMMFHCAGFLADCKGDLKQFISREKHIVAQNGGTTILDFDELLLKSTTWKAGEVPGVPYADPVTFTRMKETLTALDPLPFMTLTTEIKREKRIFDAGSIEILGSDETCLDNGVISVLPSPRCIPSISPLLEKWVNLGVGFVEVFSDDFDLASRTDDEIIELSNVCRVSGVRPFGTISNPGQYEAMIRIAGLWGRQAICLVDPWHYDWEMSEQLFDAGCFILFDFAGHNEAISQDIIGNIKTLMNARPWREIGITLDEQVITGLLEAEMHQFLISALVKQNLADKLAVWNEARTFHHIAPPSREHGPVSSCAVHRKWWLD